MTYVYANKNYTCKNRMGHVVSKFKIRNTIHVQIRVCHFLLPLIPPARSIVRYASYG